MDSSGMMIGGYSYLAVSLSKTSLADLPTPPSASPSRMFCGDCRSLDDGAKPNARCEPKGTGAWASYQDGRWMCNVREVSGIVGVDLNATIVRPKDWDHFTLLEITINGEDYVTIKPDGTAKFGPKYRPDAAAQIFWDAVARAGMIPRPEPMDVPAMRQSVDSLCSRQWHGDVSEIECTNHGRLAKDAPLPSGFELSVPGVGGWKWICLDTRRVLLASEDGNRHCVLFEPQTHPAGVH